MRDMAFRKRTIGCVKSLHSQCFFLPHSSLKVTNTTPSRSSISVSGRQLHALLHRQRYAACSKPTSRRAWLSGQSAQGTVVLLSTARHARCAAIASRILSLRAEGANPMDYFLDSELPELAATLPKMDLSDLASAREAERFVVGHLPRYEARIPLSVHDIVVPSQQNTGA